MLKTVKNFKYTVFPFFNLNFLFRCNFRAKRQQAPFKLNRPLQVHFFEFVIRDKTFNCAIWRHRHRVVRYCIKNEEHFNDGKLQEVFKLNVPSMLMEWLLLFNQFLWWSLLMCISIWSTIRWIYYREYPQYGTLNLPVLSYSNWRQWFQYICMHMQNFSYVFTYSFYVLKCSTVF